MLHHNVAAETLSMSRRFLLFTLVSLTLRLVAMDSALWSRRKMIHAVITSPHRVIAGVMIGVANVKEKMRMDFQEGDTFVQLMLATRTCFVIFRFRFHKDAARND